MGKFKVSFTTALFVFSFVICVIVAVVFVDRRPSNEYDAFYEGDAAGEDSSDRPDKNTASGGSDWERRKQERGGAAASPTPAAEDPSLADLPIDAHLLPSAQPVAPTPAMAAAQATANPHTGRSPEQIARQLMDKRGVPGVVQPTQIPGMAVPGGISTPAAAATPTPFVSAMPNTYLPVQSNDPTRNPNSSLSGTGSPFSSPGNFAGNINKLNSSPAGVPSLSNSNASGAWSPVGMTPASGIGVRGMGGSDAGMMISGGKSEAAEPPLGFEQPITSDGTMPMTGATGATGKTGSGQAPLLLPPTPAPPGAEKWDLPPAPTSMPPLISDPDRRRSDADVGEAGTETPGSENLEGSSGQALAVSSTEGTGPVTADAAPVATAEPNAVAARVNQLELTEDQAARLAQVSAKLAKKPATPDNRQELMTEAVREWTGVVAAAEHARKQQLEVAPAEVEKYAKMRPDFDLQSWKKSMAEVGFTKAEIERHLTDIAMGEKLVEAELDKKYPEKELEKLYKKAPKEYSAPRQVHVLEIFKPKPEDEKRLERVSAEMLRLQRQAKGGTDFGLLARQTSDAPSKDDGGDIGWKTPAEKPEGALAKAVTDLKPGDVSDVVEAEEGFYIYKLVAEKAARDDFEGGKELLVEKLKKDIRVSAFADAKKDQEVELSPKKEIKVVDEKSKSKPKDIEVEFNTKEKIKAKVVAEKPKSQPSAAAETPQQLRQEVAAGSQVLQAPGAQVEQRAGGAPAPAQQPGGQPAVPPQPPGQATAGIGGNGSYSPGQTIVIGSQNQAPAIPNQEAAAAANFAAPDAGVAAHIATPNPNLTPEMQAAQLRALQAQQNQTQQDENSRLQRQLQAQALMAQRQGQTPLGLPAQPSVVSGQVEVPMTEQVQPTARQARSTPDPNAPIVTQSNGWTVNQRNVDREAEAKATLAARQQQAAASAADEGPTIPPGFGGGGAAAPRASQQPTQQQPAETSEPEREGGMLSGVRNFFNRRK